MSRIWLLMIPLSLTLVSVPGAGAVDHRVGAVPACASHGTLGAGACSDPMPVTGAAASCDCAGSVMADGCQVDCTPAPAAAAFRPAVGGFPAAAGSPHAEPFAGSGRLRPAPDPYPPKIAS